MAKSKSSRKGKKEWRKNISNAVHENLVVQAQKEAIADGLKALPNDALFVVDKSREVKFERKVDKHRQKTLFCDAMLARGSTVPAVHWPGKKQKPVPGGEVALPPGIKKGKTISKLQQQKKSKANEGVPSTQPYDMWNAPPTPPASGNKRKSSQARLPGPLAVVPAVEVDMPGCSYNPTHDSHQEAVAKAVAMEMQKTYRKLMEPKAPDFEIYGEALPADEEALLFLDTDLYEDEEQPEAADDDPGPGGGRPVVVKRLTRADLNRRMRRKAMEVAQAEKHKAKKLKQELERLPEIVEELQGEEEDKEAAHKRRVTAQGERAAERPPKLSKHRFEPEPIHVPLTEELAGSLRKIKPVFNVARDRYRSLQRRGIIEPRKLQRAGQRKKRKEYEQGSRGQLARSMHEEYQAEKESRKRRAVLVKKPPGFEG